MTSFSTRVYHGARAYARRRPFLYTLVRLIKYGPFPGRDCRVRTEVMERACVRGGRILNLGSGGQYEPEAINLDVTPTTGPDVVGDGYALPFADGSIDLVVCDYVIEHVPDPEALLRSVRRALRNDGVAYFAVPFLQPLHAEPDDFTRWTREGFTRAAERSGFQVQASGIQVGGSISVQWALKEWLGTLFGLGFPPTVAIFSYIWGWLLSPLFLLDKILPETMRCEGLTSGFYFVIIPVSAKR